MYDLIIKTGTIYDGTGEKPYQSDIGVKNGKIEAIGKINEPSFVKHVAEYLSIFFKVPFEEFISITDNNFYKLFSKAIRYNEISI